MNNPVQGLREIVVLGAGPGGYAAAFHAADHGLKVTLVNAEATGGGVCLKRGCIPSKALLHIAKLIQESRESAHWGIHFQPPQINIDEVRAFKNQVVDKLAGGVNQLCNARGVRYIPARGTLLNSNTLKLHPVEGLPAPPSDTINFDKLILATGSSPLVPPIFQLNDPRVMDSTGALNLEDIPKSLLVVGGGYIGLEMGSVYAALGSKVTVVELTPGLLPGADPELVKPLQKRLTGLFEKIYLNTKVEGLTPDKKGIVAKLSGEGVPSEMTFDRVLISIGRRPNSKDLGLENTKVEIDPKGFVKVNRKMQTSDPNILAIGDIAGEPMLAHKANREAKVAVEAMLGEPASFDNVAIPAVVFTDPEVAWCGITEPQAIAEKRDVKVTRFPWAASGRAQTLARTEGLTKIIFDAKTERVLGVGIVGPGAGEMIAEAVIAVETAAVARDLADSIHAHPTLAETVMESAEMAFGQATHYFRKK
ncbi:MAG: dihydrolipoyl dehydrogenase [Planctomycetales bacterium]